eukprot:12765767-Alexandrium_andersonii.AAC.1
MHMQRTSTIDVCWAEPAASCCILSVVLLKACVGDVLRWAAPAGCVAALSLGRCSCIGYSSVALTGRWMLR